MPLRSSASFSLGIADIMGNRPEIIVTDIDHEANIATWLALEKRGAQIRWKVREDGSLHTDDLAPLLESRTRLVACPPTRSDPSSMSRMSARLAHSVGAEVLSMPFTTLPMRRLNVQELDRDHLVCSGYKIFASHMGFLWGKAAALDSLPTFREDPDRAPMKIEVELLFTKTWLAWMLRLATSKNWAAAQRRMVNKGHAASSWSRR